MYICNNRKENLTAQAIQTLIQSLQVVVRAVADISHQIRNITPRIGHLLVNIVVAQDRVNLAQDTRLVVVDENDTGVVIVGIADRTEGNFGHVDGADSVTFVDVANESITDLNTNGGLSLYWMY